MICTAFGLNSSIYCGLLVHERENKLKYAMKVMGCRTVPYWLGTYCFDLIIVTFLMSILAFLIYLWDIIFIENNVGYFLVTCVAFGNSILTAAYMYGFMFDDAETAYKSYGPFCLFILFYMPFAGFSIAYSKGMNWLGDIFRYASYIFGPYSLFQEEVYTYIPGFEHNSEGYPTLSESSIVYPILLLCQALVYMIITLKLESRKYNLKQEKILISKQLEQDTELFSVGNLPEIIQEQTRVAAQDNKDPIKVLDLTKIYENGYKALKGITFGVEKQQIFGLLGPNGAGKSTTFNILTAYLPRSSGSIKLLDKEIDMNMADVFKEVGVCPQTDCLWENLTVKDHLYVFGSMKGLTGKDLEENIQYYVKAMMLDDHIDKKAGILSGGNKRKLCVINSLIGSPSLQFFDEPSTGMDPVARRFLYETLLNNLKHRGASIVLTTHSLNEAEALCSKIGILINGRFVCLGTTESLKQKYGFGYKISIPRVKVNKIYALDEELKKRFQNIELISDFTHEMISYRIPMEGFSFSKSFKALEELKNGSVFDDYSLTNTSLEQIFLAFSKFQEVSEE